MYFNIYYKVENMVKQKWIYAKGSFNKLGFWVKATYSGIIFVVAKALGLGINDFLDDNDSGEGIEVISCGLPDFISHK